MKLSSIGVVLFVLLCLTSGYLLKPTPPLMSQEHALENQSETQVPAMPIVAARLQIDPSQTDDPLSVVVRDPNLKTVSSSGSLTISTAENRVTRNNQRFRVTGLTANPCDLCVAVFETEAGFPKSELSTQTVVVPVNGENVEFSLELPTNIPVAIAVYQDSDRNGKLTKSQMGIPKEPYGFSNNARGRLGPPAFKQAALVIGSGSESAEPIEIKVR